MRRPNVVLVVIDCLRSDRIVGSNRPCRTPNIDRLAARGAVLPNVFVENSITTPSFASFLTGRYSGNHGLISMVGSRIDEGVPTMAEIFAANGYTTYAEVTGPLHPILGIDKGFVHYHFRSQHDHAFTEWGKGLLKKFKNNEFARPYFILIHFWEAHRPVQVPPEFDNPEFGDIRYDRAVSALDAYLGRLLPELDPETLVILTGDHGECLGEKPSENGLLPYFLKKLDLALPGSEETESIDDATDLLAEEPRLHEFVGEISKVLERGEKKLAARQRLRMTANLVRIGFSRYRIQGKKGLRLGLLATMKQKVLDTLLLLAVMRGDPKSAQFHLVRNSLCEHVYQHGYHVYDYLQRVPVVFVKEGLVSAGKRLDTELRHIDLLPTLIEALHLRSPFVEFDGASYLPDLLNGGGKNRPIYLEARGGAQTDRFFLIRGLRRNRMKIAFAPFEPNAPIEFYALDTDPSETRNLADEARPSVRAFIEDAEAIAATFHGAGRKFSPREMAEMTERLKSLGYM